MFEPLCVLLTDAEVYLSLLENLDNEFANMPRVTELAGWKSRASIADSLIAFSDCWRSASVIRTGCHCSMGGTTVAVASYRWRLNDPLLVDEICVECK